MSQKSFVGKCEIGPKHFGKLKPELDTHPAQAEKARPDLRLWF